MAKKMKEDWSMEEMHEWKMKMLMWKGAALLVLGLVLYGVELKIVPWAGSIWTLGAVLLGIGLIAKSFMMKQMM